MFQWVKNYLTLREISTFRKGVENMTSAQKGALCLGIFIFKDIMKKEGVDLSFLSKIDKEQPEIKTRLLISISKLKRKDKNTMLPSGGIIWLFSLKALPSKKATEQMAGLWQHLSLCLTEALELKKALDKTYLQSTGEAIPFSKNDFIPTEFK